MMKKARPEEHEAPIDVQEFLNRVGGGISFLSELLGIYMLEYQAKHVDLMTAFASNDMNRVEEISHSLKGASASLSLRRLRETFLEIETAARSGNRARLDPALSRLAGDFSALKNFVDQTGLLDPSI